MNKYNTILAKDLRALPTNGILKAKVSSYAEYFSIRQICFKENRLNLREDNQKYSLSIERDTMVATVKMIDK